MTLQETYDHLSPGEPLILDPIVYKETLMLDPARPVTIMGRYPMASRRFGVEGRPVIQPPAGSEYAIRWSRGNGNGFRFQDFCFDVRTAADTLKACVYSTDINYLTLERVDGIGSYATGSINCPLLWGRVVEYDNSWTTMRECRTTGIPLARFGEVGDEQGSQNILIEGGSCNLLKSQGAERLFLACVEVLHGTCKRGRRGVDITGTTLEDAEVGVLLEGAWSGRVAIQGERLDTPVRIHDCDQVDVAPMKIGGRHGPLVVVTESAGVSG